MKISLKLPRTTTIQVCNLGNVNSIDPVSISRSVRLKYTSNWWQEKQVECCVRSNSFEMRVFGWWSCRDERDLPLQLQQRKCNSREKVFFPRKSFILKRTIFFGVWRKFWSLNKTFHSRPLIQSNCRSFSDISQERERERVGKCS